MTEMTLIMELLWKQQQAHPNGIFCILCHIPCDNNKPSCGAISLLTHIPLSLGLSWFIKGQQHPTENKSVFWSGTLQTVDNQNDLVRHIQY